MLSGLILVASVLVLVVGGITIASRAQRAADTASRPAVSEAATSVVTSTPATPNPISDSERIRNELLSWGLAIERVDFQDTMPAFLRELPQSVAIKLDPHASDFEGAIASWAAEYAMRYEAQAGVPITGYSVWLDEGRVGTSSSIDPQTQAIDFSAPSILNDGRATESVREVLNLTSEEARKYVSVAVATLKISDIQRQIARIEVQDAPEAHKWLAQFANRPQSPQWVIIERLGEIATLNRADDIEIIFTGLSVPRAGDAKNWNYFRQFYWPPEFHQDYLSTNDPQYIPSGPAVALPTQTPAMLSSDVERIKQNLISLIPAIARIDFSDTMPEQYLSNPETRPDVAMWLALNTSAFEGSVAHAIASYVLRYEGQTGAPITRFAMMPMGQSGGTWTSFNLPEEKMDLSTPAHLDDARATEAVREVLNLTSVEARKFVSITVTTLNLSKTQRQIARIEVQDTPEARAWLATFGGNTTSPQRVVIDRLGDISKLNGADDIEIIFAGLSVPKGFTGMDYAYIKTFYLAQLEWQLISNDGMYQLNGSLKMMPTAEAGMISPLPTPATP
jgi:hypothetical protein